MSRDGNGNYSLPAGNPVSGGTTIDPTWANTTLNDMAVALTGSVSSDGQTTMTGNIKMNGNTLTNLAAATSRSNPPNVGQVQDSALTLLSSVSGTDTITASVAPAITSYTAGQNFQFVSAGANTTTTVTININGLGAKNVLRPGGGALAVGDITSGQIVELYYNGTNFEFVNTQHAKTADLATTATSATTATTASGVSAGATGTTPSTNDNSTKLSTTAFLFNQFTGNQSVGTNGYQKLPGGLVVQWGYNAGNASGFSVVFPTSFPTACLGVFGQCALISSSAFSTLAISGSPSTSGFSGFMNSTGSVHVADPFYWFAIGY